MQAKRALLRFTLLVFLLSGVGVPQTSVATNSATADAVSQSGSITFSETGKTVKGRFLEYWNTHGGLPQQGFPISDEIEERSDTDGRMYTVQYFERAVFEYHPENKPPYDVLLSLLGSIRYKQKYPQDAPNQTPSNSPGSVPFPQTGKRLGGLFLKYWETHGGLMQQGYPISDEFVERSDLDGKEYTVQYFERALFELHPENQPPYDVLLSQLGTFQWNRKHANGGATPVTPAPTSTPYTFYRLRERSLKLPIVPPEGPCPTTHGRRNVTRNPDTVAFGSGPVYLLGLPNISDDGVIQLAGVTLRYSDGAYGLKGQWVSKPEYPGPILVRGRQLGGNNVIRFEYAQGPIHDEMMLDEFNKTPNSSGWNFWPSTIVIPGPGCYGFQIDGLDFTDVIVFNAVDRQ